MVAGLLLGAACAAERTTTGPGMLPSVVAFIKVTPAYGRLVYGDTLTLYATLQTVGAASAAVRWTSSDSTALAVSPSGQVRALAGNPIVEVCAVSAFDARKTACATFSVRGLPPKFPSFDVVPGAVVMSPGDTLRFAATVPATTEVTWSSSDTLQATVSRDGLVLAGHALVGPVAICAEALFIGLSMRECAWVNHEPPNDLVSWLLWIGPSSLTLNVGEQGMLYAFVQTVAGVPLAVEWTTADSTKVSVDGGGRATARASTDGVKVCAQPIAKPAWRSCSTVVVP